MVDWIQGEEVRVLVLARVIASLCTFLHQPGVNVDIGFVLHLEWNSAW